LIGAADGVPGPRLRWQAFPVPKKCLFPLLEQDQELFAARSYGVQNSVPLDIFELFCNSLKTQGKLSATHGNAASLLLLAGKFFITNLALSARRFLFRSIIIVVDHHQS
jgi:hypothetical protein